MMRLRLSENLKLAIVGLITLISIDLWSFTMIDDSRAKILEIAVIIMILPIVVFNTKVFLAKGLRFKINVLLFFFLPFLSVYGAALYHNQPINLSLILWRTNIFWLFYFVLHALDISFEKVIKLILLVGFVWAFLTVVQQFTYPMVYFYSADESSPGFYRGSVMRFGVGGQQYGIFLLVYFFYKYLTTQKFYTLYFVGLAIIAVFFTGGRQTLAAAFCCLVIAILLIKGVSKWGYLILFSILGLLVVLVFQPSALTTMIQLTSEQVNNEDYIRFHSANFYLNEYWPSWGAKILGNGRPHDMCAYGVEMDYINKELHFFRSDVGIIGIYNTYGIFYVLNIVWVHIKGMFLRIKSDKDKYLRLLFFYPTLTMVLHLAYASAQSIIFYCLLYFLVDKAFQNGTETETGFQQTRVTSKQLMPVNV